MAQGNHEAQNLFRRVLVAPDSSVFTFETYGFRLKPGSCSSLYSPEQVQTIYDARHSGNGNYLDIEESLDASIVPTLYDQSCKILKRLTNDQLKSKYAITKITNLQLDTCNIITEELQDGIRRVNTCLGRDGDWFLNYTVFLGGYIDNAKTVEYGISLKSFMALCQKYGLNLFGDLRADTRLFLDNTKRPLFCKGKTTISYGSYNEYDCFVKRVPVTTLGGFFRTITIQRSCNKQENMLGIFDTKCDGVNYETVVERCDMSMLDYIITGNRKTEELNSLMRSFMRGVIHLHANRIVHGAIRPQNVLIKKFDSLPHVVKITGMSKCRKLSSELKPYSFNRDIYSIGRFFLSVYTGGRHRIADDDNQAENCFRNQLLFKKDMVDLFRSHPLVYDLVEKCLKCSISAEEIYRHFCFWPAGKYIEFMQRASDAIAGGDHILRHELTKKEFSVYGSEWAYAFNSNWLSAIGGVGITGIDPRGSFTYDKRHITHLVKLIRNVSHHLEDQVNKVHWSTPIEFEWYIIRRFPKLFPAIYDAVQVSQNPTFDQFDKPSY